MPQIQPIIETLLDDEERTEMFSFAPEHEPLTEEDLIAWEKQMRESMTPEEWAKWGIRAGESDEQHALRCHEQLWADDPRYNNGQGFEDQEAEEVEI